MLVCSFREISRCWQPHLKAAVFFFVHSTIYYEVALNYVKKKHTHTNTLTGIRAT